jgi:hypothetical protein
VLCGLHGVFLHCGDCDCVHSGVYRAWSVLWGMWQVWLLRRLWLWLWRGLEGASAPFLLSGPGDGHGIQRRPTRRASVTVNSRMPILYFVNWCAASATHFSKSPC